jgi:hypothetical protein
VARRQAGEGISPPVGVGWTVAIAKMCDWPEGA